jgi:phosphoribosylanthranilate isomerase
MTQIKICGITRLEDALAAHTAGAELLGLNFYAKSPRYIDWNAGREIVEQLRRQLGETCPVIVGVFVNENWETIAAAGMLVDFDFAQLSGDESGNTIARLSNSAFKAIRPRNKAEALLGIGEYMPFAPKNERAPSILLDAYHPDLYGGTGTQASTDVALTIKDRVPRLMLAGGLNPENVAERVAAIRPWGVDVASGVEDGTPGRKDATKVRAFIEAVRSIDAA